MIALPSRWFSLNQNSGQLSIKEGAPPGSYDLLVRVSDQTWPDVISSARVLVSQLPEEALHNAGSLCLSSESLHINMRYLLITCSGCCSTMLKLVSSLSRCR